MAEIAGIDFAYTHPNPAAVRAAGYQFVLGYVSNSPGKNLTAALASAYRAAGLGVGLVWETAADRVSPGRRGSGRRCRRQRAGQGGRLPDELPPLLRRRLRRARP
jgi:hypothetical protein